MTISCRILRTIRNFSNKCCRENQNTHFIPTHTHTHTHTHTQKYVILIALPRQQWFRESASLLPNTQPTLSLILLLTFCLHFLAPHPIYMSFSSQSPFFQHSTNTNRPVNLSLFRYALYYIVGLNRLLSLLCPNIYPLILVFMTFPPVFRGPVLCAVLFAINEFLCEPNALTSTFPRLWYSIRSIDFGYVHLRAIETALMGFMLTP